MSRFKEHEMVYCIGVQQQNGLLLRCTATKWFVVEVYSNERIYCLDEQQRNNLMFMNGVQQ